MKKSRLDFLMERLNAESYFSRFTIRKKDSSLVFKEGNVQSFVMLQHVNNWGELWIQPFYCKRYDIVHKWYEKISFKRLSDLRYFFTIGFVEPKLKGFWFEFDEEKIYSNDFYQDFRDTIIDSMENLIVKRFPTLQDIYDYKVAPVLEGRGEFPDAGDDWMFENAAMTKIVAPENYQKVISLIKEKADYLVNSPHRVSELNVKRYINRLDEIFKYLDSIDLEASKYPPLPATLIHNEINVSKDRFGAYDSYLPLNSDNK